MEPLEDTHAAFAEYYDSRSTGLPGDVTFYVEEVQRAGSPVLELGAGTGRILIPIAQAGVAVTGVDLSPAMLATAQHKVAQLEPAMQQRITLIEGDMRSFDLQQQFTLAMIPFRSFVHLLTPADQRQALTQIRSHLLPGGRLIFNLWDPNLALIAANLGPHAGTLQREGEFLHPATQQRVVVYRSLAYDLPQQQVAEYRLFQQLNDEGQVVDSREVAVTVRYSFRYELEYLLECCGYEVEALYGDFFRGPFQYGREQIWVARRSDE